MEYPNHRETADASASPDIRKWMQPASLTFRAGILMTVALLMCGCQGNDHTSVIEKEGVSAGRDYSSPHKDSDSESRLSYGTWSGETKYGQPQGVGTLTYTSRRLVSQFDPAATVAEPGDYVIGEFDAGQLLRGKLYRTDGSVVEIVVTQ